MLGYHFKSFKDRFSITGFPIPTPESVDFREIALEFRICGSDSPSRNPFTFQTPLTPRRPQPGPLLLQERVHRECD